VIGMSTNLDGLTLQIFTDTTQIIVEFVFYNMINQRFTVFGAEHDVEIIGYERLSHVYCITPLRGLLILVFHYSMGLRPLHSFSMG